MKRTLLAALVLMALPALAAPPPPPDYFPLHVGDWWKYESTTSAGAKSGFQEKVTAFDQGTKLYTLEMTNPAMTIDDFYGKPPGQVTWHHEVYVKNNMTATFEPERKFLANPLSKAASWDWTGKGMAGMDISEKDTVVGPEAVVVPAGKFTAMHVHTEVTQGGANTVKDYWYAPNVGLVKSHTTGTGVDSTTVLVDYSFRKR